MQQFGSARMTRRETVLPRSLQSVQARELAEVLAWYILVCLFWGSLIFVALISAQS